MIHTFFAVCPTCHLIINAPPEDGWKTCQCQRPTE